jgi:hypothetical protein
MNARGSVEVVSDADTPAHSTGLSLHACFAARNQTRSRPAFAGNDDLFARLGPVH